MIHSFKNIINEDYFSKLANRKDNNIARKENEVEWIDLHLKSGNLWCSQNVYDNNEYNSLFTDAKTALEYEQPDKGIFLPTKEDFKELVSDTAWRKDFENKEWAFGEFVSENNDEVVFSINGTYDSHTNKHRGENKGVYWSKSNDDFDLGEVITMRIDMEHGNVTLSSCNPNAKCNIRLIKKR